MAGRGWGCDLRRKQNKTKTRGPAEKWARVWLELNWHLILEPRDQGSGGGQPGPQAEMVGERGMLSQGSKCCSRDRVQGRWGQKQLVPGNHNRGRVLSQCGKSHKRAARENTGWGPSQTQGGKTEAGVWPEVSSHGPRHSYSCRGRDGFIARPCPGRSTAQCWQTCYFLGPGIQSKIR